MKSQLTAMVMILGALAASAEEFRTWTEASTKRQIVAEVLEKDDKKKTVTLRIKPVKVGKPGKVVTIQVSRFIEEDQQFIRTWVKLIPPQDQLTVRVVASGTTRGKKVEVDVKAGKTNVVVQGGCDSGCHGLNEAVKAGKRGLFQIEVHDKYTFTLTDSKGNQIDRETALRKTGKTDSK